MFPEEAQLRATSPNTWPFVSVTRWPALYGVVATIIAFSLRCLRSSGASDVPALVVVRGGGPARAAFRARAALAQQAERVEAGRVAVAPVRRDGVVPDE